MTADTAQSKSSDANRYIATLLIDYSTCFAYESRISSPYTCTLELRSVHKDRLHDRNRERHNVPEHRLNIEVLAADNI